MRSRLAERLRAAIAAALLLWGGIAAAADPIPFRRDADPFDAAFLLRIALALGAVIALGVGGAYALRRWLPGSLGGAAGAGAKIQVLEVRRVTPRLTLFLVEIDGQRMALAQSGDRVERLPLERSL